MSTPWLIIDAHQDLAWNILTFGRDYTRSAAETRHLEAESHSLAPEVNGDTLLGFPDYQQGRVGLVFATLFAVPLRHKLGAWDTQSYADYSQAHALYQSQLDIYRRLTDRHSNKFRLLTTRTQVTAHLETWRIFHPVAEKEQAEPAEETHQSPPPPIGLVILMEGAEGIRRPAEVEFWWEQGVRLVGPAWAGTRYCGGTGEPGPFTEEGFALLDALASFNMILDLSHMDEKATLQALDVYRGPVIASHANAAALLKGSESNRFLSDRVIHGLVERGGVIGVVPYNRFLKVDWTRAEGRRAIHLHDLVAHIDYICQVAGDSRHAGLGSDFDGGFGLQSVPCEVDTIADLQKIAPLLHARGYTDDDIARIMGKNWGQLLERSLPKP